MKYLYFIYACISRLNSKKKVSMWNYDGMENIILTSLRREVRITFSICPYNFKEVL